MTRVLIVEDEERERETLTRVLELEGFAVSAVGAVCAVAGFVAWARACFPMEALEELPKGSELVQPPPALDHRFLHRL